MTGFARIIGCALAILGLAIGHGLAQEPGAGEGVGEPRAEAGEPQPAPAKGPPGEGPRPLFDFDIRYLPGPDGRAVWVPDKASLAGYLRWLAENSAPPLPPAVSVTSLSFDGTAEDERVQLMAHVELRVTSERWLRVPLQMGEATLRDAWTHTGDGQAVAALEGPDEGYTWWIKGRGKHELFLPLSVPLRKQGGQRRVQLSLPETAVSQLKLRVDSRVQAKAERSTLTTSTAGRETRIEVIGLGKRLDLTWQPQAETGSAETALEVATTVVATLAEGESAMLEATQLIKPLGQQGSFDEVRVTLPAGCELLRLDGPEHRDHQIDPANPRVVIVRFKRPASVPVELKWAVRMPGTGDSFVLEGFEVERARLQTGYLAVVVVGDVRMIRQQDEDKFLQPIDLADLPPHMRQTAATAAYRFLNRMLLRVRLQRIDPYVTVDPALLLRLSSDTSSSTDGNRPNSAMELEAAYRVQVLRGKIDGLRLRWPAWKEQGWAIEEAELPGHIELRPVEESGDRDVVRLEFAEPAKGTIDLRFRARRVVTGSADALPVALPVPEAYGGPSTPLAIVSADNVEADVRAAPGTLLRPVGEQDFRVRVPREWQPLKRRDFRLESREAALLVALSVHPRKVQATTQAEASLRAGVVQVRQKMQFDVAYERLPQLRFALLEGIAAEQIKFVDEEGRELLVTTAPSSGQRPAELQVTLEAPAIGRFEVEAQFAFSSRLDPAEKSGLLPVPLLQSLDALFSATRFACRDAAGREAVVEGEGWVRQLAADGLPTWVIPQARAAVPVRIAHSAQAPFGALVSKALIRSKLSSDGTIFSRAQYVLAEGISEVAVAFSPDLEPRGFWWNRRELRAAPSVTAADGTARYDLVLADRGSSGSRLLTVDYFAKAWPAGRSASGWALEAPRLPDELSSAEVRWQIELPGNQHLFTAPAGFSPAYSWRPGRPFWSRQCDWSPEFLELWAGPQTGLPHWVSNPGENRYAFSAFGPPPRLVFRTMSSSVLVLIGSGTALALGLVLVKWPATRHVVTLLSAGFALALLGVLFAEPVELLLQPAACGVGLVLVAAAIESFVKRRGRPVTVTLTSPSSFMTPTSSFARGAILPAGSDDFTAMHPSPEPAEPAGRLSESGKTA